MFFLDALGIKKHHEVPTSKKQHLDKKENKVSSQKNKISQQSNSNATSLSSRATRAEVKYATSEENEKLQNALSEYQKVITAAEEQLQSKRDQKELCQSLYKSLFEGKGRLNSTSETHNYLFTETGKTLNLLRNHEEQVVAFLSQYDKELTVDENIGLAGLDTTEEIEKLNELSVRASLIEHSINFENKCRPTYYKMIKAFDKINKEIFYSFIQQDQNYCEEVRSKTIQFRDQREKILNSIENDQKDKIASAEAIANWLENAHFPEFVQSKGY